MNTYLGRGKSAATFFAVLAVFTATVCLFVGVFWWYGRDYARVDFEREYFFLVRDCEDATAGAVAGQVYFSGGAGYLLETAGKSAVALSCYFTLSDAERVRSTLEERDVETRILSLQARSFSLQGRSAKEAAQVRANLDLAETCARILYDTANSLERAEIAQEKARAAVRGVVKSLSGVRLGNEGDLYERWNAELVKAERKGTEIAEGILYAKDLRYLQVELLLAIVNAENNFV